MGQHLVYEKIPMPSGKWGWKLTVDRVMPVAYSAVTYESKTECQRAIEGINHTNDVEDDDDGDR